MNSSPTAGSSMPAIPQSSQQFPATRILRALTLLVFVAATAFYITFSIHWRMMIDTPVMHYVIFLIHHGLRPYVDITDNNMPGAYLTEAAAMRLFGPGDLAWRLYEFTLLGLMTACLAFLAKRVDWIAGLLAAGVFLALHASEGPQMAAERELVVTVLLLLACAALTYSLEQGIPAAMLVTGLAGALAASIKPTYIVFPLALLAIAAYVLRQSKNRLLPSLLWAALGMLLVALLCLAFLLHFHALSNFLFILTRVLPAYAGLTPPPWPAIVRVAIPRSLLVLAVLTLPLAFTNRKHRASRPYETLILALGAAFGLLSFFAQRKGFPHHRYTFLVFLLLLLAMELFTSLQRTGWPRLWAAALLLCVLLGFIPRTVHSAARIPAQSALYTALRTDLHTLGPAQLQQNVFCFDLVYGCLNALYHEGIVENTGFTGDLLFFSPQPNFATTYYRNRFWDAMARNPPALLVVSNEDLMASNSFTRLQRWPQLDAWLRANYVEVVRRSFPHQKFGVYQAQTQAPSDGDAYILFLRNTSPLLAKTLQWTKRQPCLSAPKQTTPGPAPGTEKHHPFAGTPTTRPPQGCMPDTSAATPQPGSP